MPTLSLIILLSVAFTNKPTSAVISEQRGQQIKLLAPTSTSLGSKFDADHGWDHGVMSKTSAGSWERMSPSGFSLSVFRQRLLGQLINPANRQQDTANLPTHVMLKLIPIKIQDLDERSEVLETTIRLQISWVDQRLAWKPALYRGVNEMVIPGNALWSPDIGILNSVSDIYHVVRDTRFEFKVESTGRVWWHPTGIIKTYCKLHLRYFPFDRQQCNIVLESPTLDVRFMNLTLRSIEEPVDTVMYIDGETWDLLGVTGHNSNNKLSSKTIFSRVEFVFHIQRARIYHLLNVILPAIFLSLVQVVFFLLPATHPQRVGSSTTTLLSVVVFHSVAVAQLPRTSTDVPILAYYIIIVTFISGLSVSTSIIVAKFAVCAEQNKPLPDWLRKMRRPNLAWWRGRCRKNIRMAKSTKLRNINEQEDSSSVQVLVHNTSSDCCCPLMLTSRRGVQLFRNWNDVSEVLDCILVNFVLALALLSPFILFVILPAAVDHDLTIKY